LKYQAVLLASVLLSLGVIFLLSRSQFLSFFRIGNISAPASAVNWLGIKTGEKWSSIGINMLVIISLVTATFLFFQFRKMPVSWNIVFVNFHWIILFSLLNAFSEEMIFRFGVVTTLNSIVPVSVIILISAISFGIVHFGGTPGGFIGIGLAVVLGFILCKSIIETQGVFWAILIHFVQDVLIISSIVLSNKSSG
jgi:membrane protease YdiL (CAAX protease family)